MNSSKGLILVLLVVLVCSLWAEDITLSMEARRDLRSANIYFGQRNFEKSYELYQAVLEVDPNYINVFGIAELSNYTYLVYDVDQDYKRSYHLSGEVVEKCQEIMDEYNALLESDSRAARRFHKANIAKQNLEQVLDNNQKIQQSSWARMLRQGQELQKEGNYEDAIKSYKELYQITPDSTVVIKLIAITFKENNQPDKASEYFRKIIEIDPQDVVAINQLAGHHFSHDEFDEAAQLYKKAAEIEPENENHYFNAGICYSNSDNKEKAYKMFLASSEINPIYFDAVLNAAIMANNIGLTKESIKLQKQALEIDSSDINLIIQITYALFGQEEFEETIKYAKMWKDMAPDSEDAQNMITAAEFRMNQKK